MGGRAHGYKEFIMETFDMSNFVTEEELEQAEKANEEQEILNAYDRFMYSEDPNTIAEIATNVFGFAQAVQPDNMFFEATDNCIKWSLQSLSKNMTQFVLVEGMLSHRMKAGLLQGVFENEHEKPFTVMPSNADVLKGTAFLGKIKDEKAINNIVENVIKVANIPVEGPNAQMNICREPMNPATPQMLGFCIILFNLDAQQMSNLKKASKVKKASDKVNKFVSNASTSGYAITKGALDGIVAPSMELATKMGGLVVGTLGTSAAKSSMTFVGEVTGALVAADLPHCEQLNTIKSNCAKLALQYGRGNRNDSFSFEF